MLLRRISLFLPVYLTAFLIPPILTGIIVGLSTVSEVMIHRNPEPLAAPSELPAPPTLDPAKPVALILLSNAGTELMDFAGPYEILSASNALNVVTAAPLRHVSTTTGSLAIFPHFDLKTAPKPDLIVIPAVLDPFSPTLVQWLKENAPHAKWILAVCEGAGLAARAGLLKNRRATTHFLARGELAKTEPSATISATSRWVVDGNLITTAGVTASADGALVVLEKLAGRAVMERTASELGLTPSPGSQMERHPASSDLFKLLLGAAFDWSKPKVGVYVYPGISEIGLAASLEVFPRSFVTHTKSFSADRKFIKTRHGLDVIAEQSRVDAGLPDIVVIPSGTHSAGEVAGWANTQKIRLEDWSRQKPGSAFDQNLRTLAEAKGRDTALTVAKMIEYDSPALQATETAKSWFSWLWARILLLGILGMLIARILLRRYGRAL